MNQLMLNKGLKNYSSACADLMTMAERELATLFNVVRELFGSDQADLSAEDWLQELNASNGLPASAREWRLLTVKVFARLASRVKSTAAAPAQIQRTMPA